MSPAPVDPAHLPDAPPVSHQPPATGPCSVRWSWPDRGGMPGILTEKWSLISGNWWIQLDSLKYLGKMSLIFGNGKMAWSWVFWSMNIWSYCVIFINNGFMTIHFERKIKIKIKTYKNHVCHGQNKGLMVYGHPNNPWYIMEIQTSWGIYCNGIYIYEYVYT